MSPQPDVATMYFLGVSTGASSINRVFQAWTGPLGLADARLQGIDLPLGAPAAQYRATLDKIAAAPLARGALVTTHKLDVLAAGRDLFDGLDRYARLLDEVSCIVNRDGRLFGYAKDPQTSGLALDGFLPAGHWAATGASVLILGAGGSATALLCDLADDRRDPRERPTEVVVTDRRPDRLQAIREVAQRFGGDLPVRFVLAAGPDDNDNAVAALPRGSLVVNATGLGKDGPGSPLSDTVRFPTGAYAWDFNYRGDLEFLAQARTAGDVSIEDGWTYFVHGWTRAIAEVFGLDIATSGPDFDLLAKAAREAR